MEESLRLIVVEAIVTHFQTRGCLEWDSREAARIRRDGGLAGLTVEGIKALLVEHVKRGGRVDQRSETRLEKQSRREYWYRVLIPNIPEMPRGLFVELELYDPDPECPSVLILNAHRQ